MQPIMLLRHAPVFMGVMTVSVGTQINSETCDSVLRPCAGGVPEGLKIGGNGDTGFCFKEQALLRYEKWYKLPEYLKRRKASMHKFSLFTDYEICHLQIVNE